MGWAIGGSGGEWGGGVLQRGVEGVLEALRALRPDQPRQICNFSVVG